MRLTKSGRLDERYTGGAEGNAVATVFGVLIVLIGWGGYYLYNLFFGEGEETDASLLEEVESAPVEESGGVLEFIDHLATEETILFWCLLVEILSKMAGDLPLPEWELKSFSTS